MNYRNAYKVQPEILKVKKHLDDLDVEGGSN
jgi:hypothetical protein